MKDRVVQYPNRYKLTQVATDTYDLTPEPGMVTEDGTDLNKASLLTDETAEALGLSHLPDPTVDDAFKFGVPIKSNFVFGYNPRKYSQTITASQNWTVPAGVTEVDVWLVGGGGGAYDNGGSGGAGGHCQMFKNVPVSGSISIVIGAGGSPKNNGGSTSFNSYSVDGGGACVYPWPFVGGSGGSGGGAGASSTGYAGHGGSGGANGNSSNGGHGGQGTGILSTINPYSGVLYAGGGGGFATDAGKNGLGGAGGGGDGAATYDGIGKSGTPNTGGGGGAGYIAGGGSGSGGSGVCIIYWD